MFCLQRRAYYGIIYPFLTYAVEIWGHECVRTHFIFKLQKRSLRSIFNKPRRFSCKSLFLQSNILTFPCIYILSTVKFVHKHLSEFSSFESINNNYNFRNRDNIIIPRHKTSFFEKHLLYNGVKLYNALPGCLRSERDTQNFSRKVKQFLLKHSLYSVGDFLVAYL